MIKLINIKDHAVHEFQLNMGTEIVSWVSGSQAFMKWNGSIDTTIKIAGT